MQENGCLGQRRVAWGRGRVWQAAVLTDQVESMRYIYSKEGIRIHCSAVILHVIYKYSLVTTFLKIWNEAYDTSQSVLPSDEHEWHKFLSDTAFLAATRQRWGHSSRLNPGDLEVRMGTTQWVWRAPIPHEELPQASCQAGPHWRFPTATREKHQVPGTGAYDTGRCQLPSPARGNPTFLEWPSSVPGHCPCKNCQSPTVPSCCRARSSACKATARSSPRTSIPNDTSFTFRTKTDTCQKRFS